MSSNSSNSFLLSATGLLPPFLFEPAKNNEDSVVIGFAWFMIIGLSIMFVWGSWHIIELTWAQFQTVERRRTWWNGTGNWASPDPFVRKFREEPPSCCKKFFAVVCCALLIATWTDLIAYILYPAEVAPPLLFALFVSTFSIASFVFIDHQ